MIIVKSDPLGEFVLNHGWWLFCIYIISQKGVKNKYQLSIFCKFGVLHSVIMCYCVLFGENGEKHGL